MAAWAVFDVDGTLVPGSSLEKHFLFFLFRQEIISARPIINFLAAAMAMLPTAGLWDALRANKAFFAGMDEAFARRAATHFFRKYFGNIVSREGLQEMARRREKGYRILLLSGAPLFLLEALNQYLNVDWIEGCRLEVRGNRFTGRIVGEHPSGLRKRTRLLQVQNALELDFSRSVVFANHASDALHMELFREVVAVNPDRQLARIARQRGWTIRYWH